MFIDPKPIVLVVGMLAGGFMFAMLSWSIAYPAKRVWPPEVATRTIKFFVWAMTILIFVASFLLGVIDWNRLQWPAIARWGFGLTLIILGNLVVWRGVHKIGMAATSGEATGLVTDGLYRWSRNPQYVADVAILVGWGILAASLWALPVVCVGLAVLIVAPFAEEQWLEDRYGASFRNYQAKVRRFI